MSNEEVALPVDNGESFQFKFLKDSSEEDDVFGVYGKSSVYEYVIEPVLGFDHLLQGIVTHCRIVKEGVSSPIQIYDGLGSCLYAQIPFLPEEEKSLRTVIIDLNPIETEESQLIFEWEAMSFMDFIYAYGEQSLQSLSNKLSLRSVSTKSLSLFIKKVLRAYNIEDTGFLSRLFKVKANEVRVTLEPYDNQESRLVFSLLDESGKILHTIEAITNYTIGSTDFFITSKDQYRYQKLGTVSD